MNRLSPLIVRHYPGPRSTVTFGRWDPPKPEPRPLFSEDFRLFLTGWLGGLVFFGTFLG